MSTTRHKTASRLFNHDKGALFPEAPGRAGDQLSWVCSSKAFTLSGKILQLTKISMEQAVLGRRKTEARPQNIEKTREAGVELIITCTNRQNWPQWGPEAMDTVPDLEVYDVAPRGTHDKEKYQQSILSHLRGHPQEAFASRPDLPRALETSQEIPPS